MWSKDIWNVQLLQRVFLLHLHHWAKSNILGKSVKVPETQEDAAYCLSHETSSNAHFSQNTDKVCLICNNGCIWVTAGRFSDSEPRGARKLRLNSIYFHSRQHWSWGQVQKNRPGLLGQEIQSLTSKKSKNWMWCADRPHILLCEWGVRLLVLCYLDLDLVQATMTCLDDFFRGSGS